MDIFAKPVNSAPEETPSFAVVQPSYYESSEETDFDELSDVESDFSVEYIRHESRMTDEDEEEDAETVNSESESPEEYQHYCPQVLPPVVSQQRGKRVELVKRQLERYEAISRLYFYQFQYRERTSEQQDEDEPLSPTTCYVYTEDISPSGTDDYPPEADSPDLRDNDTDEDDTNSYTSQDTLIGDYWFGNKHAEIMEMGFFY